MFNLNELTVITPYNDGESKKIIEICHHLNIDLRISNQKSWVNFFPHRRIKMETIRIS